jgi:hypothetical protein
MPRQWSGSRLLPFANAKELSETERVFYIVDTRPHRPARGRFPEQCQFIITLDTLQGEKQKLTLAVAEDRLELERFIREDPSNPVGPCQIHPIDADTPSGFYWVIETIEREKAPTAGSSKGGSKRSVRKRTE